MKKWTEEEIHRKFAEAFFECVYMDLNKEASYYREGVEKYLDALTTEDINQLLLEVNINYDNYIISEANKLNAIENSKLIQTKNPDDGLLEINALTVQLIQALDKQLINDFRQNMLNSDEKINKENLPNMIRKALDQVLNNKTTTGRNTLIASKINNLSEENKRKVIKHVYLYFMDEFIQTYPFLKQNS